MKRAFYMVYLILALNFCLPALWYAVAPGMAVASFAEIGALFDAGPYPHSEDSVLWRVLAIANVATLGFCCLLLLRDLERWYRVLTPLVFLKGMASLGFLVAFAFEPYPSYFAAFLLDAVTVAAMIVFARGARREGLA